MDWLALIAALIVVIFTGVLGGLVLWAILTGRIDLSQLISEENGKASVSRFQFLVFAFIIASSFLVIALEKGVFPSVSSQVVVLFGISGATYVISKGIQRSG